MKIRITNVGELDSIAQTFIQELVSRAKKDGTATIVGLYGNLGAGKTAFSKACARVLGIEESVTSPTFVIEKIYALPKSALPFERFVHIDAYRLEESSELMHLGWHELCATPENLIFIEWPERVLDSMPPHSRVSLSVQREDEREIHIEYV